MCRRARTPTTSTHTVLRLAPLLQAKSGRRDEARWLLNFSPWRARTSCATLARKNELNRIEIEHNTLPESPRRHFKNVALLLCVIFAGAGWLYVIYNQHRSNEPVEIVKKHFVFYREYSQGVWREGACAKVDRAKCRDVTYTVPVSGCGPITFDWNVFPDDDGDTTWSYNGTTSQG